VVTIGIDAHKGTLTAVAVDDLGRETAQRTFRATSEGHFQLIRWVAHWPQRRFATEDCRHLTRRLESDLIAAGETVVRVHTRLMASERRGSRERGKSDPIDALAVARVVLREPDLPVARLDGPARELRLLVDHREALVRERTRLQNRLRWHLHELEPALEIRSRSLRTAGALDQVREALQSLGGLVAELARDLVDRCRALNRTVSDLERRIRPLVRCLGPSLLAIPGCGVLSAAKILGETADVGRFSSPAAFARFNGTAPIPVWSSNTSRFRLNRGGNRRVNTALHMIAVTQLRGGLGKAYVEKRMAGGNTKTEAVRLLRRRLSDVVFRAMQADERTMNLRLERPLALVA
jgi:transposase